MKSPIQLAQIQLDAYNAFDIDKFVSVYHDDIEVFDFPNSTEPRLKGKTAFRQRYADLFQKATVHVSLVGRLHLGDYVIDQELVFGMVDNQTLSAIAIYQIEEGLIRRVWFIR